MISLQNVSKFFGQSAAVKDISFEVGTGEKLVLLGTSGCGKTTTLRMINRLIEPSAGDILINGKNIKSQPPEILRRGIGYVLQHHGLFPHYTIQENIAIVPKLLKWNDAAIRERTALLLQKLNIDPQQYLQAYPAMLSGGQQQRVGLARALAADPPILLMDEPFGALDPITRAAIKKELLQLDEFRTKTIIMVTHDVQEAFELGDRICLMDKGSLVQIGKAADFLFHPANDYVSRFLASQRLLLLYKSIRLQDLHEHLPPAGNENGLTVDAQTSVWEVMEILAGGKHDEVFVPDAATGTRRKVDMQNILQSVREINYFTA